MNSRLRGVLIQGGLALSFLSMASAYAEPGVTEFEISIGNPNAQTGDNAYSGRETTIGINTYISALNAQGGVNGRKIRIINCDDKYKPDGAEHCFDTLSQTSVFALIGLVGSAPYMMYIPRCIYNKMPAVGFYSGPEFVGSPIKRYIFPVRPSYREEEHQFVEHMWKDAGFRKFAILYQEDAYGTDHLAGLKEALKQKNSEPVMCVPYKRNTADITEAFAAIKRSNAEAVCLAANHHQCEKFVQMARAANWSPVFFINSGANIDAFMENVAKGYDRIVVSEIVPEPTGSELPLAAKYRSALKRYFPNEKPCYTSLRGYVDALILTEGLKLAGRDLTREKFVDALNNMASVDIGLGRGMEIRLSDADHWGLHKYIFSSFCNGSLTPIKNWSTLAQPGKKAVAKEDK